MKMMKMIFPNIFAILIALVFVAADGASRGALANAPATTTTAVDTPESIATEMTTAGDKYKEAIISAADKHSVDGETEKKALYEAEKNIASNEKKMGQISKMSEVMGKRQENKKDNNKKKEEENPDTLTALRDNATGASRTNMIDKAITGVSTAAMGIGGMQLAQGLAEQSADKAAKSDMEQYLSTFHCTYAGHTAKGGQLNIALPGDSKALELMREEYANKAKSLKELKEQLDIKPGIEAELVLDRKETGLYQNIEVNRAESTYGRLSTSLQDANSRDATMLKDQEDASKKRVTGGAIAVAGGAAVAVGGHALLDKFGAKDKSAEILNKAGGGAATPTQEENKQNANQVEDKPENKEIDRAQQANNAQSFANDATKNLNKAKEYLDIAIESLNDVDFKNAEANVVYANNFLDTTRNAANTALAIDVISSLSKKEADSAISGAKSLQESVNFVSDYVNIAKDVNAAEDMLLEANELLKVRTITYAQDKAIEASDKSTAAENKLEGMTNDKEISKRLDNFKLEVTNKMRKIENGANEILVVENNEPKFVYNKDTDTSDNPNTPAN